MSLISVADIGSFSTRFLLGKEEGGLLTLVGLGKSESRGMKGGRILDPKKAGRSLEEAKKRAEKMASTKINSVSIGAGGATLSFSENKATISITSRDMIVQQNDLERLKGLVRSLDTGRGQVVISAIPSDLALDGQHGVTNPIGLRGRRLDMRATLALMDKRAVRNYKKAATEAGLELAQLLPCPLCLGELLLTEDETRRGQVLLDFGKEKTELIIYSEGKLVYKKVFSFGGKNLTGDLAARFDLNRSEAVSLKHKVDISELSKKSGVRAADEGIHLGAETLGEQKVFETLAARVEEMFELIILEINRSEFEGLLDFGVKLTGGSPRLGGLVQFLNSLFDPNFELAKSRRSIQGIKDVVKNSSNFTALALLNCKAENNAGIDTDLGESRFENSSFFPNLLKKFR